MAPTDSKDKKKHILLDKTIQEKLSEGLKASGKKYNIDVSSEHTMFVRSELLIQNNSRALKTRTTYQEHYVHLWCFLAMVGDYDSMLILSYPPLKNVPSACGESLLLYLRYKKGKRDTPLTPCGSQTTVQSVLGTPIMCNGGWANNQKMEQFSSAISLLHLIHGHEDSYMDECNECKEAFKKSNGSLQSCVAHLAMNKSAIFLSWQSHKLFCV